MAGSLFLKECRQIVRSIPFFVYVAVLILFLFTQYVSGIEKIDQPQPGQESYGTKLQDNPDVIMPNAIESLYREFTADSYVAYPVGFYKEVKLNDGQQQEMSGILSALTGISRDRLLDLVGSSAAGQAFNMENMIQNTDGNYTITGSDVEDSIEKPDITMYQNMTYGQFCVLMNQADKLIGGGSKYGDIYLIRFGEVPMTYEDALLKYNSIVNDDRVTGAYARLFCDYIGVVLAIFPVFLAVAWGMKDRRAGMRELIYTRKISSFKIVLVRFFAMLAMMFFPVLLMAAGAAAQIASLYTGFALDYTAFMAYSFGWLLPTLMGSVSVGVFLTELTDTPVAIAVQGFWWFLGLFTGIKHLDGGYGWDLALRHNEIGNFQVYSGNFQILLLNRIGYTVLALVLLLLTVRVYEMKRRGKWNVHFGWKKSSAHRLGKSKA